MWHRHCASRRATHRSRSAIAKALVKEMPHTYAALTAGTLTWYRARVLVSETACLSLPDRRTVDRRVCGDLAALHGVGTRKLAASARKAGYELDPVSIVRRAAKAENERYVSLRPAPDCMTWLTALLPVAQGVACYAALKAAATSGIATGDGRGLGQLMADTLVTRITGQTTADAVPIGLHLVMPSHALLGGDCAAGPDRRPRPDPGSPRASPGHRRTRGRVLGQAAVRVPDRPGRDRVPVPLLPRRPRRADHDPRRHLLDRRGATPRSATSTTSPPGPTTDPPPSPTAKASAPSATSTNRTDLPNPRSRTLRARVEGSRGRQRSRRSGPRPRRDG